MVSPVGAHVIKSKSSEAQVPVLRPPMVFGQVFPFLWPFSLILIVNQHEAALIVTLDIFVILGLTLWKGLFLRFEFSSLSPIFLQMKGGHPGCSCKKESGLLFMERVRCFTLGIQGSTKIIRLIRHQNCNSTLLLFWERCHLIIYLCTETDARCLPACVVVVGLDFLEAERHCGRFLLGP